MLLYDGVNLIQDSVKSEIPNINNFFNPGATPRCVINLARARNKYPIKLKIIICSGNSFSGTNLVWLLCAYICKKKHGLQSKAILDLENRNKTMSRPDCCTD